MCVARPNVVTVRRNNASFKSSPSDTSTNFTNIDDSEQQLTDKSLVSNYRSVVLKNNIHIWVLPLNISQSKYGGRKLPSSACTLITVQMAHDFLDLNIPLPTTSSEPQALPVQILDTLVNAIVDGNETHGRAMTIRKNGFTGSIKKKDLEKIEAEECNNVVSFVKKPQRDTFTVPEAISAQNPNMHEIDYRSYTGQFIPNLIIAISMAVTSPHLQSMNRLTLGILAFERAMCIVYDRSSNILCLLDTHMHFKGRGGSIIVIGDFNNLADFVITVVKSAFSEVFHNRDLSGQFEISCMMLTKLSNCVHKKEIFRQVRNSNIPYNLSKRLIRLKSKRKMKVVDSNENENDSGYDSDE